MGVVGASIPTATPLRERRMRAHNTGAPVRGPAVLSRPSVRKHPETDSKSRRMARVCRMAEGGRR